MRNLIICLFLLSVITLRGQGLTKTFKVSDRIFDVPESWKSETPSFRIAIESKLRRRRNSRSRPNHRLDNRPYAEPRTAISRTVK